MEMLKKVSFYIIALFVFQIAWAEPASFLVAASSSSGTYQQGIEQIQTVCGNDNFAISVVPNVGGATENLDALKNNKVSAAFLHTDIIYAKAQTDSSYRKIKTLVSLYPEEVHVVALRTAKETTGGIAGIGASSVTYTALSDLSGRKVGASGGSIISAKILSGPGGGGFEVVSFDSGKDALAALENGTIQAAIFVGGAPLPNLAALSDQKFQLLPIGDAIISKVTGDSGVISQL